MLLLADIDQCFESNQFSCVKLKNQFKSGNAEIALGGVIHPELSLRRQIHKKNPVKNKMIEEKNVEIVNPHFNIADTKIYFQGEYSKDNWSAGYRIRIYPSVDEIKVDQNYGVFFHKGMGTFQLGFQKGVHDLLAKLAQRNMPTIWIYGGLEEHIDKPNDIYAGNELEGHSSNAFKLNWISPHYLGIRTAFTYAPNINAPSAKNENPSFNSHHFTVVLSYKKELGDFSFQAAGVILGEFQVDREKSIKEQKHKALSFMISSALGWKKWKGAFEFLNSSISRISLMTKETKGNALNLSLSYEVNERHAVGFGGQYTWCYKAQDKKLVKCDKWLGTLGYAFKWVECATWYIEGSVMVYNALERNEGFILRTGLRITI